MTDAQKTAQKIGRGRPSLGRINEIRLRLTAAELAAIESAVASENAELLRDGSTESPSTVTSWILDHALDPLGLARHDVRD